MFFKTDVSQTSQESICVGVTCVAAEGLLNVDIAISQQQLLFRNLVKNFIKRDSMAATSLKSHFGMGVLL